MTLPPGIAKLRTEIEQVAAEMKSVRAALPPIAATEAVLKAKVQAAGARFAARLSGQAMPDSLEAALAHDPVGLLCALMPERITAFATEGLRREMRGRPTLTAADREAELARLGARQRKLERDEEAAIRRAESAGLEIDRRPDADVRAVMARLEETTA